MNSIFTAVIDANVFYGIRVTSLILHLAQADLFRARWSEKIHEEWISNLHRNRGLAREKLQKRREAIDASVLDCLVTDYQALECGLSLPDPNDRHVFAAALKARANCIVTFNLADFPSSALDPAGIAATHPDQFLIELFGISQTQFTEAVWQDFHHYKAPPLTFDQYIDDLRKSGVPKTAKLIEELRILIDAS